MHINMSIGHVPNHCCGKLHGLRFGYLPGKQRVVELRRMCRGEVLSDGLDNELLQLSRGHLLDLERDHVHGLCRWDLVVIFGIIIVPEHLLPVWFEQLAYVHVQLCSNGRVGEHLFQQ